jgi:hypothetical protein
MRINYIEQQEFKKFLKVRYIPYHAKDNSSHENCEIGYVSSVNEYYVFVKFERIINNLKTWDITAQACNRQDLKIIKDEYWWGFTGKLEEWLKYQRRI